MPTLSSHQVTAVTLKVNRLITLSRDAHEERDFRTTGHLTATSKDRPRWYPSVLPFRYNPCAGTDGSPESLPSRTPVDSGAYQQVQLGGVTLDSTLEMVRQRHQ